MLLSIPKNGTKCLPKGTLVAQSSSVKKLSHESLKFKLSVKTIVFSPFLTVCLVHKYLWICFSFFSFFVICISPCFKKNIFYFENR